MSRQDSIKTAASDQPPHSPLGPSGSSSGGAPPQDWGLEIGSAFPSADNPKYTIKAEIDTGGMGIVYEAHQGELGVVAIKVIKPRILSQAASERFLNEARAMAKVRAEPGIATIFDCDFYTDAASGTRAPFIVMEYVPGALPITTYASEHRLGLRARLELFRKVCEAMAAAHGADIIHRDLKPANVMVDARGHPKVIDFGLAVVHDPAERANRVPSERGGLFGTLEYMSPEQAAKRFDPHVLTAASDVYSLGVILYELLLGQLPYPKHPGDAVKKSEDGVADYTEATRIIREDAPVAPHRLNRSIHPRVEAILLKALEKDPARRYKTAGELSAAISRHLMWGRKRDLAVATPIVVLASWLAGVIAVPALFLHTPANTWFMNAMRAVAPPIDEFEHVLLVTMEGSPPASCFEPLEVTDQTGMGFRAGERTRPLIGSLCAKLSRSACRVVALDAYYQADARPGNGDDDALLKGVKALEGAGIDWVMATEDWEDRPQFVPRVMSESGALCGSIWLHADPAGWYIDAALERDQRVMPSFALAAAAVYRHPGKRFAFMFDRYEFGVYVTALEKDGTKPRSDFKPIPMTRIVPGDSPDVSKAMIGSADSYKAGNRLALLTLPAFPSDEVLKKSRRDATEIMAMTDEELRKSCENKVVVLANTDADFAADEWKPTPDGRVLPKSFGHALAIETLLQGEPTVRSLDRYMEIAATLTGALVGAGIGLRWAWRPGFAVMAAVLGAVAFAGVGALLLAISGVMCNPIVPSVALVLAMVMGLVTPIAMRFARGVLGGSAL